MTTDGYPAGIVRPFDIARDFPAVVELLNRRAEALGEPPTDEAQQRRYLDLPGHDLSRDRWIAFAPDGACLGFADVWRAPDTPCADVTLAVAQDAAGRSLRDPLLERVLRRTRELGAGALLAYVRAADEATAGFFRDRGFEAVDGYRGMVWDGHARPGPPAWPDGFRLRTYRDVGRPAVLVEAGNRCYRGMWGHKVANEASARQLLEDFPSDGILLLYDEGDRLVGWINACEIGDPGADGDAPSGYLDGPGVVPEHRGGRLHADLVRAGLQWLRERGHRRVRMDTWGEDEATIADYEGVGFRRSRATLGFALRLREGGSP